MGVFSRVSTMFKAKVNSTLDDIENPIELLDQKLREMESQLSKAKLSSAQIIGNSHDLERKYKAAQKEAIEYESKVKLALSKGNEELAKKALERKISSEKKANTLRESYQLAKTQADSIKKNLMALENEISKTRSYRDEAAARLTTAEASQKVNEVLANVQTKNNTVQIDSIERKIQRKESMASGLAELRFEDTFESEFNELDSLSLDDELTKYKLEALENDSL